jgi:hypothetical protein
VQRGRIPHFLDYSAVFLHHPRIPATFFVESPAAMKYWLLPIVTIRLPGTCPAAFQRFALQFNRSLPQHPCRTDVPKSMRTFPIALYCPNTGYWALPSRHMFGNGPIGPVRYH